MASPALSLFPSRHELDDVMRAVLTPLSDVVTAFVTRDGSSVRVDLVVGQVSAELWGQLLEVERNLDARWPGLSFELLPHESHGRSPGALSFLGEHPIFQRPS